MRVPLTVIGGFLGAGKTTLLNRVLSTAAGRRLAVLVNDFGSVNVDAALVSAASADTIALTNGCVCCSIGDDLAGALIRVLEASPPFDGVVVEASGVSDPWRIAQIGLADPGLALDGVIVLLDAAAALEQARDPLLADSLVRQLRAADFIVVNKTDLVDAGALSAVRAWVGEVAGPTPVFETSHAVVPPELVWSRAVGRAVPAAADACDHHDGDHAHEHAEMFETWVHHPTGPLKASALRGLLRAMPPGVLRLKGLLRTDEHDWAEVQFAGRHGSLRKAHVQPTDESAVVVAIGLRGRLPRGALDAWFGGTPDESSGVVTHTPPP